MKELPGGSFKIFGELSRRMEKSYHRLMTSKIYSLGYLLNDTLSAPKQIKPDAHPGVFSHAGQQSGRYLLALIAHQCFFGLQIPRIERIAKAALAEQRPDGNFGPLRTISSVHRDDFCCMSGQSWLLKAFLELYLLFKEQPYLEAAMRLVDWYKRVLPAFDRPEYKTQQPPGHLSWVTMNLDGVVLLYRITKKEKYLDLANYLADLTLPYGPFHTHHFLSSYRGLLDLYETTKSKDVLKKVTSTWSKIKKEAVLPTGGICELFPISPRDEGCSEADFVRVALSLFRATGEGEFMDMAERALLNALFMDQVPNGGFTFRKNIDRGRATSGFLHAGRDEAFHCCTLHAPQALLKAAQHLITFNSDTVWINLFFPCSARFELQKDMLLEVNVQTRYPQDEFIQIIINPQRKQKFQLKVRIPEFVNSTEISINNIYTEPSFEKGYASFSRIWKKGDKVQVRFTLQYRYEKTQLNNIHATEDSGSNVKTTPEVNAKKDRARQTFSYGPLCLASEWNEAPLALKPIASVSEYHNFDVRFIH